jgi:hypothetical protein
MKKEIQKRLHHYAKLAGAAATAAPLAAQAQAVYTDVDPDTTLNIGDLYELDFNADGNIDMLFAVTTNSFTTGGLAVYQNFAVASGSGAGSFAGTTQSVGAVFYFPQAYAPGVAINSALSWQPNTAFGSLNYLTSLGGVPYYQGGNWENTTDQYLAVRFPAAGATHYGWVRMDAGQAGSSNFVTIKDYAFESQPEVAFETADTVGAPPVSGLANTDATELTVYTFGNNLFLRSQDADWSEGTVEVLDMTGRRVSLTNWTGGTATVKVRVPNGIYSAILRSTAGAVTTRKVYVGPMR